MQLAPATAHLMAPSWRQHAPAFSAMLSNKAFLHGQRPVSAVVRPTWAPLAVLACQRQTPDCRASQPQGLSPQRPVRQCHGHHAMCWVRGTGACWRGLWRSWTFLPAAALISRPEASGKPSLQVVGMLGLWGCWGSELSHIAFQHLGRENVHAAPARGGSKWGSWGSSRWRQSSRTGRSCGLCHHGAERSCYARQVDSICLTVLLSRGLRISPRTKSQLKQGPIAFSRRSASSPRA